MSIVGNPQHHSSADPSRIKASSAQHSDLLFTLQLLWDTRRSIMLGACVGLFVALYKLLSAPDFLLWNLPISASTTRYDFLIDNGKFATELNQALKQSSVKSNIMDKMKEQGAHNLKLTTPLQIKSTDVSSVIFFFDEKADQHHFNLMTNLAMDKADPSSPTKLLAAISESIQAYSDSVFQQDLKNALKEIRQSQAIIERIQDDLRESQASDTALSIHKARSRIIEIASDLLRKNENGSFLEIQARQTLFTPDQSLALYHRLIDISLLELADAQTKNRISTKQADSIKEELNTLRSDIDNQSLFVNPSQVLINRLNEKIISIGRSFAENTNDKISELPSLSYDQKSPEPAKLTANIRNLFITLLANIVAASILGSLAHGAYLFIKEYWGAVYKKKSPLKIRS